MTKAIRVSEVTHRKMKLVAAALEIPLSKAYEQATEAYISKLKSDNPVYEFLLHATDFQEDNGASAVADMFPESNSEVK